MTEKYCTECGFTTKTRLTMYSWRMKRLCSNLNCRNLEELACGGTSWYTTGKRQLDEKEYRDLKELFLSDNVRIPD